MFYFALFKLLEEIHTLGPDRLESIILKIIGKKIDNPPCQANNRQKIDYF